MVIPRYKVICVASLFNYLVSCMKDKSKQLRLKAIYIQDLASLSILTVDTQYLIMFVCSIV